MTDAKNNGGAAFPVHDHRTGPSDPFWQGSFGMTLRDWFAGQWVAAGRKPCRHYRA